MNVMESTPDTWSRIADIATALGVVVALVAVVVTLVMTLRSERLTRDGQQLEREQAEATAARSEAAAALSESYTRRVVDALESLASQNLGPAGLAAQRRGVVWAMTHHTGDTYQLKNEGDAPADNISLSVHETMHLIELPNTPTQLAPGEALTFMASRHMGTRDSTVTVTWQDPDGEIRQWRYPLPPKPPT